MRQLEEIADSFGTDKRGRDHGYTATYTQWFESRRMEPIKILEIGLGAGGSVRTWREYFPNGEIYAIEYCGDEYKDLWKSPSLDIEGVKIIIGSQSDPKTWEQIPNGFDYIIDDGSHIPEDVMKSVELGFYKLKPHGLWFIEDTHCNFHKNYTDSDKLYPWIADLIVKQQIPNISTDGNFYRNRGFMPLGLARDIYSYHFYKSMIILEKA